MNTRWKVQFSQKLQRPIYLESAGGGGGVDLSSMGLGGQVGQLLGGGGPHGGGPQPLWGLCSLPQGCYRCLPRTLLHQIQSIV